MTHKKKLLSTLIIPLTLLIASCSQSESIANDSGVYTVNKENGNPAVAGKFDGKEISVDELEKLSPDVFDARLKVYQAQKRALEDQVRNLVVENLAKKANLSVEEFTNKEMENAKKKVSAKEVEEFLKKNNVADLSKVPEHIKDQVKGLLHMKGLIANATKSNKVEVYLKRPKASPINFTTEGEATWGDANAPVQIVEFSDFQCPFCAQGKEILTSLKKKYGKKIHIVFKNFPLPPQMHPEARPAAEAAMCVLEQSNDKFWKYHDMLFENQSKLMDADLKAYAKKVGADEKKFDECYSAKKYASHIDKGMEEGRKNGVDSTPTFFVNSQPIRGAREADFAEIIDEALGK